MTNSNMLTCQAQRELGIQLAQQAGALKTRTVAQDPNNGLLAIVKTAIEESKEMGGLEILVNNLIKGPSFWAYTLLRLVPDTGPYRDSLLARAAEEPMAAYHTLLNIKELGHYRDTLLQTVTLDPGYSQMALSHLPDLGTLQSSLLAATTAPPVEKGWGYNTYFVNQSGRKIWAMYNTGAAGTESSITGPVEILKDQNIGFGRGATCISELKIYFTQPAAWTDLGTTHWYTPYLGGCSSWGFRIDVNGVVAEAEGWQLIDPGMPAKYPPQNGTAADA